MVEQSISQQVGSIVSKNNYHRLSSIEYEENNYHHHSSMNYNPKSNNNVNSSSTNNSRKNNNINSNNNNSNDNNSNNNNSNNNSSNNSSYNKYNGTATNNKNDFDNDGNSQSRFVSSSKMSLDNNNINNNLHANAYSSPANVVGVIHHSSNHQESSYSEMTTNSSNNTNTSTMASSTASTTASTKASTTLIDTENCGLHPAQRHVITNLSDSNKTSKNVPMVASGGGSGSVASSSASLPSKRMKVVGNSGRSIFNARYQDNPITVSKNRPSPSSDSLSKGSHSQSHNHHITNRNNVDIFGYSSSPPKDIIKHSNVIQPSTVDSSTNSVTQNLDLSPLHHLSLSPTTTLGNSCSVEIDDNDDGSNDDTNDGSNDDTNDDTNDMNHSNKISIAKNQDDDERSDDWGLTDDDEEAGLRRYNQHYYLDHYAKPGDIPMPAEFSQTGNALDWIRGSINRMYVQFLELRTAARQRRAARLLTMPSESWQHRWSVCFVTWCCDATDAGILLVITSLFVWIVVGILAHMGMSWWTYGMLLLAIRVSARRTYEACCYYQIGYCKYNAQQQYHHQQHQRSASRHSTRVRSDSHSHSSSFSGVELLTGFHNSYTNSSNTSQHAYFPSTSSSKNPTHESESSLGDSISII